MQALLVGELSRAAEAIKASGLPISSCKALGSGADVEAILIKCPSTPSRARTAIYLMHKDAEALVYIGDTEDDEIIKMMLDQNKPVYIHYTQPDYVVGLRLNWEEDF